MVKTDKKRKIKDFLITVKKLKGNWDQQIRNIKNMCKSKNGKLRTKNGILETTKEKALNTVINTTRINLRKKRKTQRNMRIGQSKA